MKKAISAALISLASISAQAKFVIQVGEFATQSEAQTHADAMVNDGIPAYTEASDNKVLLRVGPFETRDQAKLVIEKIRADSDEIDAAIKKADKLTALAKQMDGEWQIYSPTRHSCETLHLYMGKIQNGPIGIYTPEQFAAFYGDGATVKYGHGGDAAEVDVPGDVFMLAHGTDACNEMVKYFDRRRNQQ